MTGTGSLYLHHQDSDPFALPDSKLSEALDELPDMLVHLTERPSNAVVVTAGASRGGISMLRSWLMTRHKRLAFAILLHSFCPELGEGELVERLVCRTTDPG